MEEHKEPRKAGAPPGNDNATKNKPFREALDRAIAQDIAKKGEQASRLRRAAENLLTKAAGKSKNNLPAIGMLADRLDGKAVQPLAGFDGGELKVILQPQDVDA